MTKFTLTVPLLLVITSLFAQVNLTTSNLPILIIETDDGFVSDEPKVGATMKIIDNGPEMVNNITDEVFDYNGRIGIELRGQTSQNLFPKKPYGIETRDEAGENNNVSLLGMPKENDWVLHNPYSDKSLIRNALTYTLAGKIMEYAPRIRMVEVIIDEDYKGVYLLTEKIKRDKNRINIAKLSPESEDITGGYILKFDKGERFEIGFTSEYESISGRPQRANFLWHYPKWDEITTEQANYIEDFVFEMEDVLASENFADPLEGYQKYLDVETFMDFLIINEISRNVDGYRLSSFLYKDSDVVDGRLKMGPVWDFNLAFGNANYCEGSNFNGWGYQFNNFCPQDFWVIHFWWRRLLQDPNFKEALRDRWNLRRANELSDDNIFGTIDSLSNLLLRDGAADRNFKRWNVIGQWVWPNNFVGQSYREELNYLTSWTQSRLGWLDVAFNITSSNNPNTSRPDEITVFPNPTVSSSAIKFDYTFNSRFITTVKIYNAVGQYVTELTENETAIANEYEFTWRQLPPAGVYFYNVISLKGIEFSGKVLILD